MICVVSGKETSRTVQRVPIHNDVMCFARSYRDHLLRINKGDGKNYTAKLVLGFLKDMVTNDGYDWGQIQEMLMDEMEPINETPA